MQPVHDLVVDEGGAALVHHLGLALRIEVLRDQAHDAQDFALPGLQLRRVLLEEVEDVLLRQLKQLAHERLVGLPADFCAPLGSVRQSSL